MASLVKQFTFSSGPAVSAQVNQNFDDIIAFINANCIQKDGSLAFEQIPVGPNSDPTTANQFTRKSYVDAAVTAVSATAESASSAASAAQTTATSVQAAIAGILTKFSTGGGTFPIDGTTYGGQTMYVKAGYLLANVDGSGDIAVNFGAAFPNGLIAVTANLVLAGTINTLMADVAIWSTSMNAFKARIYNPSTGNSYTSGSAGVSWHAFGY